MRSEYDSFACDPTMEIETPCDSCEEKCQYENNFEDCPRWKEAEQEAAGLSVCDTCKDRTQRKECGDCPLRYKYDWEL